HWDVAVETVTWRRGSRRRPALGGGRVVPRPPGSTGLCAAPVGAGPVKLGRRSGVKYADFELPTDAEVATLLGRALDLGVNLFGTAPDYGSGERRLAPFVKTHRGEIVLATRCGETFGGGSSRWDFRRSAPKHQIAQSLRRLGTGHVGLLFLHATTATRRFMK